MASTAADDVLLLTDLPEYEDSQHDDVTLLDLASNFILRHENAPAFPQLEARNLLPETPLGGTTRGCPCPRVHEQPHFSRA
jgi:hypothetical protein